MNECSAMLTRLLVWISPPGLSTFQLGYYSWAWEAEINVQDFLSPSQIHPQCKSSFWSLLVPWLQCKQMLNLSQNTEG